eukprot:COSAG02_NODE_62903_length_264_cov_1.248485_1_plen_23_part_01
MGVTPRMARGLAEMGVMETAQKR